MSYFLIDKVEVNISFVQFLIVIFPPIYSKSQDNHQVQLLEKCDRHLAQQMPVCCFVISSFCSRKMFWCSVVLSQECPILSGDDLYVQYGPGHLSQTAQSYLASRQPWMLSQFPSSYKVLVHVTAEMWLILLQARLPFVFFHGIRLCIQYGYHVYYRKSIILISMILVRMMHFCFINLNFRQKNLSKLLFK